MKFSAAILTLAALVVCSCSGKAAPVLTLRLPAVPLKIRVYSAERKGIS